jgi:hypothetical protein
VKACVLPATAQVQMVDPVHHIVTVYHNSGHGRDVNAHQPTPTTRWQAIVLLVVRGLT